MSNENIFGEGLEAFQDEIDMKPEKKRGRPSAPKEDYEEKIKKLEETNEILLKTNENLQKMYESTQKQLSAVMDIIAKNNQSTSTKQEGATVKIGCRAFSGACLRNRDETILHLFAAGEEQDIDAEDLRQILKDNSVITARSLFEKGIFYFVDKEEYAKWGIKQRVDLSQEAIVKLVTNTDIDAMIRNVKEITKDKTDVSLTHSLKFIIAQMIIDNKNEPLRNWRYENRIALENYLGNKFDDLITNVGLPNMLRYMHG